MKIYFKMILLLIMTKSAIAQTGFKAQQLTFERVKNAYNEKWVTLQKKLKQEHIPGRFSLYMVAYKSEGQLEIWIKPGNKNHYQLFKVYPFCQHSGILGPKVKEGDLQTPEGFYYVNVFNPKSIFHLSLGINYPNSVDLLRSGYEKPGGDIYIHGNCVTVGCIPITDEKIKELYVLGVEARSWGQDRIPVHIFPFKMTTANLKKYLVQYPQHKTFWTKLQQGYNYFEKHKQVPSIAEGEDAAYQVK